MSEPSLALNKDLCPPNYDLCPPTCEENTTDCLILETVVEQRDVGAVRKAGDLCASLQPEKDPQGMMIMNLSYDPYNNTDREATKVADIDKKVDPCEKSENKRKISEDKNKNKNLNKQKQKQQTTSLTTMMMIKCDDDSNGEKLMNMKSTRDDKTNEQTDYRCLGARPKIKMEKIKKIKEKLPQDLKLIERRISRDPRQVPGLDINGFGTNDIKSIGNDVEVGAAPDVTEAQVILKDSLSEHQNTVITSLTSEVKPLVSLERIKSRLDNNLDDSFKISTARKVKRGSVATLRAKFENMGTSGSNSDNLAEKVDVKRLSSSSSNIKKQTTPASARRRMSRAKVSKKDSIDPQQSKINETLDRMLKSSIQCLSCSFHCWSGRNCYLENSSKLILIMTKL